MPKPKTCQVCRKEFSHRSLEFDHHYACYFDKNTNAWLDHGSEPEERTERKRMRKRTHFASGFKLHDKSDLSILEDRVKDEVPVAKPLLPPLPPPPPVAPM